MTPPHVLVAIPARDEEETVAACVRGVLGALDDALAHGAVDRTHVEIAAHRCQDATADVARAALEARLRAGSSTVSRDDRSHTVGEVRHAAVLRGLARLGGDPSRIWVLSTDADTIVGSDWVRRILAEAALCDAIAVAGLADLDQWQGAEQAEVAYETLIEAKIRAAPAAAPDQHNQHDHVYGANLAVRADAYLACGGFPREMHGEDRALVDLLTGAGFRVARTTGVRVRTSGRLHGRARLGLAARLHRLHLDADELTPTGTEQAHHAAGWAV